MMVDTDKSQVLFTYIDKGNLSVRAGDKGIAFSPDGKYLYLLATGAENTETTSIILDANTGKQVGSFPSRDAWGLAISPNGKTLAIGHTRYVELFDLH